MSYTCLVISNECDYYAKKLTQISLPDLKMIYGKTEKDIEANIAKADIILGIPWLITKHIKKAQKLSWIQSTFAGIEVLVAPDLPQDYILTNVKDVYGSAMAEYVFAYILGLRKKIFEQREWQKEHKWDRFLSATVANQNIGIVGTGSIGKEIARVAKTFGMNTKGLKTTQKSVEHFDKIYTNSQQSEFFDDLDYIVSVLPDTKYTRDFFNKNNFKLMKPSSVFINIGRGKNVCEPDLIDAIKEKKIAGAVLDVFVNEPLPTNSPLWDLPNVFITSHVSGNVIAERKLDIFVENYQLFCAKKPLKYQIDFQKGY